MNINPEIQSRVRKYLNDTFERRIKRNPKYSLRSFAVSIDINPATLSQILNGKRPITKQRVEHIASMLEIPLHSLISNNKHENLSVEVFKTISEWYHDAILELTHLDDFEPSIQWVADKLNLNINSVKIAVERLQRLELLEIAEDGNWIDTKKDTLVSYDGKLTNGALKKYQRNILELSAESITSQKRGERDHCSFIFSLDSDLVPEIHQKIKDFQLDLMKFVEENSNKRDDVRAIQFSSFKIISKR